MSRWLWLVKWLLVTPHYIVLLFLWLGFFVLTVIAFFAVLFTGRYPRGIFDFNVGVLRWSWRVAFYTFGALGTDEFPPFMLGEVPEYPARLEIDHPQDLRRGLPLIGWWLLGIPQFCIAGIFAGAGWSLGLTGILVSLPASWCCSRVATRKEIFDLVLGLNRRVLRGVAYAAFMTREYPLLGPDTGPHEPHFEMKQRDRREVRDAMRRSRLADLRIAVVRGKLAPAVRDIVVTA